MSKEEKEYTLSDVEKLIVKSREEMTYYITMDNDDRTKDTLYRLKCTEQEARKIFLFAIRKQAKERRNTEPMPKWRILRLFDANDKQLAQES